MFSAYTWSQLHIFVSIKLLYYPFGFQVIASSATKKGELLFADINTQLKHGNITADVKVDTDSNVIFVALFSFFL